VRAKRKQCFSFLMSPYSWSVVWMPPTCETFGLVIHELLHSFGLRHSNLRVGGNFFPYGGELVLKGENKFLNYAHKKMALVKWDILR
jgi:hypothetical protein